MLYLIHERHTDPHQARHPCRTLRLQRKSQLELEADGLTELDIIESIVNAVAVYKTIRSQSPFRKQAREYLHIIQSTNLEGLMIYSKGKLVNEAGIEIYYFLISSKKAI